MSERLRQDEQDRADRFLFLSIVLSLLAHVALIVLAALFVKPVEPLQGAEEPLVTVQFVDAPMAAPAQEPPDTDVVSQQDAVAESPETVPVPEPAPAPRVVERPPAPPSPRPRPEQEQEQEQEEREPGDDAREDGAPPRDDGIDKRARLEDVLRGLRNPNRSWADVAQDAPPLEQGSVGGDSMQFESKADVDWGPYAARIKRIVRSNWRIPMAAQAGSEGITQVHFYIRRDGGIEDLEVKSASGTIPLDIAARDAIALSDALPPPPLPVDLDEERVGVTWTFLYNVDEQEWRQWIRRQRLAERAR